MEKAYTGLFEKVADIERADEVVKKTFRRWEKAEHLDNIRRSGYFRYTREIVFSNREKCDGERLIGLAKSQGGLQGILKFRPESIENDVKAFEEIVQSVFGNRPFDIDFGYRMRIGVR